MILFLLILLFSTSAFAADLVCDDYPVTSAHPDYFKVTIDGMDYYSTASFDGTNKGFSYDVTSLIGGNHKIRVYACQTTNLLTNGSFSNNENWTWGTGWTFNSNSLMADKDTDGTGALVDTSLTPESSTEYEISYVLFTFYTGTVTPSIGGTNLTERTFANGLNSASTMTYGTTATQVKTTQFWYAISGTAYSKAETDGTTPGDDVIPSGKYGAIALDIGADGNIDVIEASANSTGYDTSTEALAGIAAAASDHVRIGTVYVTKSDGDFTFGTTAFDAENVTYYMSPASANSTVTINERVTTTNTNALQFVASETARLSMDSVRVVKVGYHGENDTCSDYSYYGLGHSYITSANGGEGVHTLSIGEGSATATWTGGD